MLLTNAMSKYFLLPAGFLLLWGLSACATIFTKSKQNIVIKTIDEDTREEINGAQIIVDARDTCESPCHIRLKKKYELPHLTIRFDKYVDKEYYLETKMNWWTLLNAPLALPLIVDIALQNTVRYDPEYKVSMKKTPRQKKIEQIIKKQETIRKIKKSKVKYR